MLLNIIHNFIPRERIVWENRNPPWMNNKIKKLINEKNLAYKSYCRFNIDVFLFEKFKFLQNELNVSTENFKQTYYSKLSSKLANPVTSLKTFWSILKAFLNNKKFLVYLLCFMKINLPQTLQRELNFLIRFLQINALYWTTALSCPII